jgi:hypothetical protein
MCAWCKEYQGMKPPFKNTDITHGCCNSCVKKVLKKAGINMSLISVETAKKTKSPRLAKIKGLINNQNSISSIVKI